MAASRVLLLGPACPRDATFRPRFGVSGIAAVSSGVGRQCCSLHLANARRVYHAGRRSPLLGDHRAACATEGVLVRRACPFERAAARVCYEAGARVATNVALRDLNLGVPVSDGRRLEVVANCLPAFGGIQVAVDVTLVSPLRRDGSSRPRADSEPGLALREATERKRRATYPEFQGARRCRLIVFAAEVGGRWGEAEAFLQKLACGRALASPAEQRGAVAAAYARRWGQMLAIAAQTASASCPLTARWPCRAPGA